MTANFRTSRHDIPVVGGLNAAEGWVDMRVQFLVDKANAGSDQLLLGWTVLPRELATSGTVTPTPTSSSWCSAVPVRSTRMRT